MYGYKRKVNLQFEKAVLKVREELAKEGFGVLTEIDVKATMKKKLNVEFEDYIILGACNPPFAYQALQVSKDAGLMMPCDVVVYCEKGNTFVNCVMPTAMANLIQDDQSKPIAEKIENKLKKVVDSID
jgi:uncharacterized protein (DUF302 family)